MVAGVKHDAHVAEDGLLRAVEDEHVVLRHGLIESRDNLAQLGIAPGLGVAQPLGEIFFLRTRLKRKQVARAHRLAVRLREKIGCGEFILSKIAFKLKVVDLHSCSSLLPRQTFAAFAHPPLAVCAKNVL